MIRRADGLDCEQFQSRICCQQVVKRRVLKRDVMHPLVSTPLLIVRQRGSAMMEMR